MIPTDPDPFVGAQILAVDDDEVKRYSWERILSRAGFDVATASTGGECLVRSKDNPDLIILDIRLPDISGMEVCRKLKAEPTTSSIPVLHISASMISPEDRTAALEGGADGYLTEPLDPEELVASVKALLRMRRAEEVARRAAAEWQTTFDTIPDGIVVADAAGAVLRCNEAFLRMSGLESRAVTGVPLRELLVRRLGISGFDLFKDAAERRARQTAEAVWKDRWMRLTLDPILTDDAVTGCIATLSDMTQRKTAELKVQELNAGLEERVAERTLRLQSANHELEAFSYTIAHDLRAPLRAIHRFSEILLDEYGKVMDDSGRDYARRIVAGAEKMDALINGLLEYSRLSQSEFTPQPLETSEVLAEVLRTLMDASSARNPEIEIVSPLPGVTGDRLLLQQVFQNLISNALKFVREGVRPHIRISGERVGEQVVLSIADNGLGISPDSQKRLFRVFERLDSSRNYPGTGIGLAIVRRAVERMGGEVGVESTVGQGSRFWIRLPADRRKTA